MIKSEKKYGKNELEHLIFENAIREIDYCGSIDGSCLSKVINNCTSFERPDIISFVDNTACAIEHFEYDFYKHTRKGSLYQQEEANISRKLLKNLKEKDKDSYIGSIDTKASVDYFIYNFLEVYSNHYKNILEYKTNVKKELNIHKIKMWFIAEFTGGLPAYYQTNDAHGILHPLLFKEVAEIISKNFELDGIAFVDHENMFLISRNMFSKIKFLKKEEVELMTANAQVISFATKL